MPIGPKPPRLSSTPREKAPAEGRAGVMVGTYVGRHVTRVLADLEIEHELCRPYRPEDKPHIERFLGTLTRDPFAHLPDFTGHDVAQAKALRETRSFAARRRGETPTFELHLTADELQRRCDLWLSEVYETRPHGGLDGMTPRLRAASWTGEVRAIADVRALNALLALTVGNGTRVVSKKGLGVGGRCYIAPELGPRVGERVGVREDAADPVRLHVFAADGRFICLAGDPARKGVAVGPVAREATVLAGEADRRARRRGRDLDRRYRPERAMDDVLAAAADSDRVVAFPSPATADETAATSRRAVRSARARIAAANRHVWTFPRRQGFFGLVPVAVMYYVLCWALAFRCLPWIMMVSRLAGGDDHQDVVEANNDVSF